MKFLSIIFLFLFLLKSNLYAQVGIGTTNPLTGTSLQIDGANTGVLINRVSLSGTDDVTTIPSLGIPQRGLMVYNTNPSTNVDVETDVVRGFYLWDGDSWEPVAEAKRKKTGWVSLTDANSSFTLPFVNDPDLTDLSNFVDIDLDFTDDVSDATISGFAPDGYAAADFYDSTASVITPLILGDAILVRLQFDAQPSNNNGVIVITVDIGAPFGIVIFEKTVPLLRGNNRVNNISESILLFQLGTFVANGAKIRLAYSRANQNTGTSCVVNNFSMVISRLSTPN